LKSAFRAHALATHPDLRAEESRRPESLGEDFIKARAEYEAALRYLAPKAARMEPGHENTEAGDRPATAFGKKRDRFDRTLFYADFSALLKCGFPKTARHDKERKKYVRLRLHVRSSLASLDGAGQGSTLALFDAFERVLATRKELTEAGLTPRIEAVIGLLMDLISYEECGIVPLRASIEIEFASLKQNATDPGLLGFLAFLVGDMDGGTTIL